MKAERRQPDGGPARGFRATFSSGAGKIVELGALRDRLSKVQQLGARIVPGVQAAGRVSERRLFDNLQPLKRLGATITPAAPAQDQAPWR